MLLVVARAPPAYRQLAVCRLSSGPACRSPGGGSPALRSLRLLPWLEDGGLWSGQMRTTGAGARWNPRPLGSAVHRGPAREIQRLAPGESVRKPFSGDADARGPSRHRSCGRSKPHQWLTRRDEQL